MNGDLCLICDSLIDSQGVCWTCAEQDELNQSGGDEWYEDDSEHIYIPYAWRADPDGEITVRLFDRFYGDPWGEDDPRVLIWLRACVWSWRRFTGRLIHAARYQIDRKYRASYDEVPF